MRRELVDIAKIIRYGLKYISQVGRFLDFWLIGYFLGKEASRQAAMKSGKPNLVLNVERVVFYKHGAVLSFPVQDLL